MIRAPRPTPPTSRADSPRGRSTSDSDWPPAPPDSDDPGVPARRSASRTINSPQRVFHSSMKPASISLPRSVAVSNWVRTMTTTMNFHRGRRQPAYQRHHLGTGGDCRSMAVSRLFHRTFEQISRPREDPRRAPQQQPSAQGRRDGTFSVFADSATSGVASGSSSGSSTSLRWHHMQAESALSIVLERRPARTAPNAVDYEQDDRPRRYNRSSSTISPSRSRPPRLPARLGPGMSIARQKTQTVRVLRALRVDRAEGRFQRTSVSRVRPARPRPAR